MIQIRFLSADHEHRALGWLPGRFSFRSWSDGRMIVPDEALPALALEGITFVVEGPATYERLISPIRDPAAAPLQ